MPCWGQKCFQKHCEDFLDREGFFFKFGVLQLNELELKGCFSHLRIYSIMFSNICHLYAAAAAKSLQSCPTLCDPTDSGPPGSPFPGFSRQEHWSGLPFPSPMHESGKWKWKWSRSVVSDSSRPHGLQPTRLLCPWGLPGKSTGVGCHCLLQQHRILHSWSPPWVPFRVCWRSASTGLMAQSS